MKTIHEATSFYTPKKKLDIIPEPVSVTWKGEGCLLLQRGDVIATEGSGVRTAARYLSEYSEHYLGIPLALKGEAPIIRLKNLRNGSTPGGYRLNITTGQGILIEGNDAAGVFYGVQTLIQLLPTQAGVLPLLPLVEIEDYPRFAYRGLHLDVVRHFFPVHYIKKYLDYMALHKLNYFHWHLSDDQAWRLQMHCRPELTEQGAYREGEIEGVYPGKYHALPYGGYYTHEDVREVVQYAKERHITVIPEIDIPGHCLAVLETYPHFSTTPQEPKKCAQTWHIFDKQNNVLAPTPEVFSFLREVFTEVADLFPGQYIHVGGDECAKRWWRDSEETQQFMRRNGLKNEAVLQSYFIYYVQQVLKEKGKTLIGWDEILEGGISTDCIVMNWRRPTHGRRSVQTGHRTIFTSIFRSYFNLKESRSQQEVGPDAAPLPMEKMYSYEVMPQGLTYAEERCVWGVQGCLWTEYVQNPWKVEFALFPRLSALAENAWSLPERKEWEHFAEKVPRQVERYELWGARYSPFFLRSRKVVRKR